MNLQEFIKKYENAGIISDRAAAEQVLDEFRSCFQGKKAVIYGAGILGKSVSNILEYINVEVAFLLDRNFEFQAKKFNVPVYAPEYLLGYSGGGGLELLLAVNEQILGGV